MENTRRKIIKAGAAAPLIATVRPASAVPKSSFHACAQKDAQKPAAPFALAENAAPDDWLRAPANVYAALHSPPGQPAAPAGYGFFKGDGPNWWKVRRAPGGTLDLTDISATPYPTASYGPGAKIGSIQQLVVVDSSQQKVQKWVGMGSPSGYTQTTHSCFMSIV